MEYFIETDEYVDGFYVSIQLEDIAITADTDGTIWLNTEGGEGMTIFKKELNDILMAYYKENF